MSASTATTVTASSDADVLCKLSRFKGQSITTALQLDHDEAAQLLLLAKTVRYVDGELPGKPLSRPWCTRENPSPVHVLQGVVLVPLFFENSTRTFSSFVSAMLKCCGGVCALPLEASSINKGETFEDTIRAVDCYADVICLRHPDKDHLARACAVARHPVINCGNGVGEHPSQALLDLFCMTEELGTTFGKSICLIGDLKHGRTVHSLAKQLATFNSVGPQWTLHLISPAALPMPQDVLDFLGKYPNLTVNLHDALTPAIVADVDVLYVTRVQKERFASEEEYKKVKGCYVINKEMLAHAKQKMVVMHPLPRVDEISTDIDDDPRACYFREMKYGLHMRMAMLLMIMGKLDAIKSHAARMKAGAL